MTEKKSFKAVWSCPSNIALVKYWGKKPGQLPLNPSLSFSLREAKTITSVVIQQEQSPTFQFLFEGKETSFGKRVKAYLDELRIENPWINEFSFKIESNNTFPHSAGIASSASAFGALALCLIDLEKQVLEKEYDNHSFLKHTSRLARIGSGSACRSMYGGFSIWGRTDEFIGSSDAYAVPMGQVHHDQFKSLRDAVLLVDSGKKKVSSSAGHQLMNEHFYRTARIDQANKNLNQILKVLQSNDLSSFFDLVENEALSLHAMMLSSQPSYVLLKPESLCLIEKIRSFREQTGLPVGFTIDAGPNIHLLYFSEDAAKVRLFIKDELQQFLEDGRWLDDRVGDGPVKLE